jgi:hypothetical protein
MTIIVSQVNKQVLNEKYKVFIDTSLEVCL